MEQTEKSKVYAEEGLLERIKLCLSKKPLPSPTDRKKFDHDFAISTSFHGVHNIVRNRSKIRKAMWLAVVLSSVSLVVWQIYSRLVNYFSWPTTTSIAVQYVEKIEFPAVTFCNLNRFQTDAVTKFGSIFILWNIVSKVLHFQEISANSTGFKEAIDFLESQQNFSITEFVKKNGFYLNNSTLLACDFFGKPCSSQTVRQEYPWGECNPNIKLQNFGTYSTSGCLKECKARHIEKQCGCLPFLLPGNGIECDLQKFYNCVSPTLDHIEVKGLCTMGTHNSSCPVPCEETEYPATVSYSTFPSQKALKHFSKKLNQSQKYIRNNLVNIEINYSDLNYKITQQQKAVSVSELLADVGGQLGLFCGASMITIIEIIEYIFTNFYWICILLLLKIPEMTPRAHPPQTHLGNKNNIEEC
ncbi:acid-sensing ion channel 5 isoform X6 [Desmodus rotundus]|uniref:acid-sensing ion channel 5 isoform X6 n=1 Tax=Desmodus rotundus TaxID=9430 RepID=UPI00238143E0|nr:acid-sensing ion channel 5 isoform X6 [Desmodus rotundus]